MNVVWEDSVSLAGWVPIDQHPLTIRSAGILVSEMEDRYVVATSYGPGGQQYVFSPMHIPKRSVITIETVLEGGI